MYLLTSLLSFGLFSSLALTQYVINPDSVPLSTRNSWCTSQTSACVLICLQYNDTTNVPLSNTCQADNLAYSCVCSNGLTPNASEYSQTLPYFVCTEWGNQCVTNCGSDNTCASSCRSQHPCGAQNPTRVNTTSSSMMSMTGSMSSSIIPFGAGVSTSKGMGMSNYKVGYAPVGVKIGQLVLVSGLIGGFAVLL